jgi:hypothetical protein
MIADGQHIDRSMTSQAKAGRVHSWHLWTVFIPRRSIAGRLVWGMVWRRRDGRHWNYKKFIEYPADGDS